jgi:hypothetical protein
MSMMNCARRFHDIFVSTWLALKGCEASAIRDFLNPLSRDHVKRRQPLNLLL